MSFWDTDGLYFDDDGELLFEEGDDNDRTILLHQHFFRKCFGGKEQGLLCMWTINNVYYGLMGCLEGEFHGQYKKRPVFGIWKDGA